MIDGDQIVAVREIVADYQEGSGLSGLAARTRRGEMDELPMVQVAVRAVERVLGQRRES